MGFLSPSLVFFLNRIFLTLLSCFLSFAIINSVTMNTISVYILVVQHIKFPEGKLGVGKHIDFQFCQLLPGSPPWGSFHFHSYHQYESAYFPYSPANSLLLNIWTSEDLKTFDHKIFLREEFQIIYVDTPHSRRQRLIFPPLECGLILVTCFYRIECKGKRNFTADPTITR